MKTPKKNLLLPLEWPAFLPTRCERCDNLYEPRFSLSIGPCRLGRALKPVALWMPVVSFTMALPGTIRPIPLIINTLLPSIMLFITIHLLPKKARLHCHNCRKTDYFEPPESWSHRLGDPDEDPTTEATPF